MKTVYKEYPCGCKITAEWPEGGRLGYEIDYCPLHKSAPDLYGALGIAVRVLRDNDIDESMAGEFEILTDALAKADGGK